MSNFKITELGEDFLLVKQPIYKPKVKVTVLVTEYNHDNQVSTVVSEKVEYRDQPVEYGEEVFVFSKRQYQLMEENYALGACAITTKGLARYCLAYGSGTKWYKCPARTAKQLVSNGVKVPKELYGLLTLIPGSY